MSALAQPAYELPCSCQQAPPGFTHVVASPAFWLAGRKASSYLITCPIAVKFVKCRESDSGVEHLRFLLFDSVQSFFSTGPVHLSDLLKIYTPSRQLRSSERICTVCDSGQVGDEFHYLLNCSNENVKRNRTKCADKYYTHHPNVPKFCSFTSKSKNVKLAKFISCIFELF